MPWKILGIILLVISGLSWLLMKGLGGLLLLMGDIGSTINSIGSQAYVFMPIAIFLILFKPNSKGFIVAAAGAAAFLIVFHVYWPII